MFWLDLILKNKEMKKFTIKRNRLMSLRGTSTGEYVNSLTISVRDEKGELFDFNGFPLEFEIEIN